MTPARGDRAARGRRYPVPEQVELGFHLCDRDDGHRHFMARRDLAVVTEMANRRRAAIARRIDWAHVPVPADRDERPTSVP